MVAKIAHTFSSVPRCKKDFLQTQAATSMNEKEKTWKVRLPSIEHIVSLSNKHKKTWHAGQQNLAKLKTVWMFLGS